jgi:endonuclease YncB( thermonuclease family)
MIERPLIICSVTAAIFLCAGFAWAKDWSKYENCELVSNEFNDGDSFHVKCGRRTYIFRLHFVDAPETSKMIPDRVAEQAELWKVSESRVLASGKEAAEFTRRFLKKPFTVHTKREDAMGRSKKPRYFAFIETQEGFLSRALIDNGLARVYGVRRALPDGTPAKSYLKKLDQAAIKARRLGMGIWKDGKDASLKGGRFVKGMGSDTYLLKNSITLYSTNRPPRFMGTIPRGTSVKVEESVSSMLVRVTFSSGEKETEGLCRRTELTASGVKQ